MHQWTSSFNTEFINWCMENERITVGVNSVDFAVYVHLNGSQLSWMNPSINCLKDLNEKGGNVPLRSSLYGTKPRNGCVLSQGIWTDWYDSSSPKKGISGFITNPTTRLCEMGRSLMWPVRSEGLTFKRPKGVQYHYDSHCSVWSLFQMSKCPQSLCLSLWLTFVWFI